MLNTIVKMVLPLVWKVRIVMGYGDPKSFAGRPVEKSELLGQVFTPKEIALFMVRLLLSEEPRDKIAILDPCVGAYTFPQALDDSGLINSFTDICIVDIDPKMVDMSVKWSFENNVILNTFKVSDYLSLTMEKKYDRIIMNPPYVRQEWLDNKKYYQELFLKNYGCVIPGVSNLYVYFMVKALDDLKSGGTLVTIIYDSWMSTLYGKWLIDYMNEQCEKLEIHSVQDQPFEGRLIDATIIKAKKKSRINVNSPNKVNLKYGNSDHVPEIEGLEPIDKLFFSRRGLRLKQVNMFMSDLESVQELGATPFVKKVGKISGYHVPDTHDEAALIIGSNQDKVELLLQELHYRLDNALQKPEKNQAILTWYRERPDSWFIHNDPPKAPIIFNYFLRNRPRHIYNKSRGYADNFYGLVARDDISIWAWLAILNSTFVCCSVLAHARSVGNGLFKIQLFRYREVLVPDLSLFDKNDINYFVKLGQLLVSGLEDPNNIIRKIDTTLYEVYSNPKLHPKKLENIYEKLRLGGATWLG